jgi:hypothetical protein
MAEIDTNLLKNIIKDVLEEVGLISPFMDRKEVIAIVGRARYEKAYKTGLLDRNKLEKGKNASTVKGKNAKVKIKRADFVRLLNQGLI